MSEKVGIIGSGYVGANTGRMMADLGHSVLYYDINEERVTLMRSSSHEATASPEELADRSDVMFLCVNTPTVDGRMDDSYIRSAVKSVGKYFKKGKTLVVKSTVTPGTTEDLVDELLRKASGLYRDEFGLVDNPEFITQISGSWSDDPCFSKNDGNLGRVVVGVDRIDDVATKAMCSIYKHYDGKIIWTTIKTAEMVKYASNVCLASRVSYWNQIKEICDKIDVNSAQVADIVSMDERIGKYGATHGKAYGGTCLPKDTKALAAFAEDNGVDPILLKAVDEINERTKKKFGVRE